MVHPPVESHVLEQLRGGLVVSCQALPGEPLFTERGGVMPLLATAAHRAGAVGIRANSGRDIAEIVAAVPLPVIGLVKREYRGFGPYITPTIDEVDEVAAAGASVVALDYTDRPHPHGSAADLLRQVRERHPHLAVMADVSTLDEGLAAAADGVDCVGTTLSGYTPASQGVELPHLALVAELARRLSAPQSPGTAPVPVVAEGGIHTPEQARAALDAGAFCVVVGGAITRPLEIATRFVTALAH